MPPPLSLPVCVYAHTHVCPAAEQDPIWFAPLACEARLWGSTSLYSPNGFPSPLLLTLPQTPVMCTLVNIHIHDSGRERGNRLRCTDRKTEREKASEREWNKSETKGCGKKKKNSLSSGGSHFLTGWPWGWGLFNLGILRASRWARRMLEWWGPAYQNGRRSTRSGPFPRLGHEPGVICVSRWGWSSGAAEVKLSAAVATHSIPPRHIHMVLHQCCAFSSLPLPLPFPPPWAI